MKRFPLYVFGGLVVATVAAFFITQHLKVSTPFVGGFPNPDPGYDQPDRRPRLPEQSRGSRSSHRSTRDLVLSVQPLRRRERVHRQRRRRHRRPGRLRRAHAGRQAPAAPRVLLERPPVRRYGRPRWDLPLPRRADPAGPRDQRRWPDHDQDNAAAPSRDERIAEPDPASNHAGDDPLQRHRAPAGDGPRLPHRSLRAAPARRTRSRPAAITSSSGTAGSTARSRRPGPTSSACE